MPGCLWIAGPEPHHLTVVWFWWARLFFENCTVDASISGETRRLETPFPFCGGGVWGVGFHLRFVLIVLCVQVFKGIRWMPWHQEPMKDVGGCDMPRGVGNQTLIRGFPNGETWHSLWGVAAV